MVELRSLSLIISSVAIFLVANEGATNGSGGSTDESPGSGSTRDGADKSTTSCSGSSADEGALLSVTQWL
jgi:hypothetical protein